MPKAIRDRLQLTGGERLEIEERGGVIEIRPAPAEVEIVETPEGPVAAAVGELPALTDEAVREALERIRR